MSLQTMTAADGDGAQVSIMAMSVLEILIKAMDHVM